MFSIVYTVLSELNLLKATSSILSGSPINSANLRVERGDEVPIQFLRQFWVSYIIFNQFPDHVHQGGRSNPLLGMQSSVDPHGRSGVGAAVFTNLGYYHGPV